MSCYHFKFNGGHGWLTLPDVYSYEGFTFEWHSYCGPTLLRKDGEPSSRVPKRFWDVLDKWDKLTEREKEKTRV